MRIGKRGFLILACLALLPAAVFGGIKGAEAVSAQIALMRASNGIVTTSRPIEVIRQHVRKMNSPELEALGPTYIDAVLVIDGKKNPLVFEFEDPARALENARKLDADYIALAQKEYGLGELTDRTWNQYKKKILPLGNDYGKFSQLNACLEIYGEGEKGRDALQYVEFADAALKAGKISRISIDPIKEALPSDSPILYGYSAEALQSQSGSVFVFPVFQKTNGGFVK